MSSMSRVFGFLLFSFSPQWRDLAKGIPLGVRSDMAYKQLQWHWVPGAVAQSRCGVRVLSTGSPKLIVAPESWGAGLVSVARLGVGCP